MDREGSSKHGDSPSQGTHTNLQTSVAKRPILSGPSSSTPLGLRFSTLGATSNKLARTGLLRPSSTASSFGVSGASAIGFRSPTLGPSSATAASSVRSGSSEGTSAVISSATSSSAVKPSQAKRSLLSVSGFNSERNKVDRISFKRKNSLFSNINRPSGSPQERTDISPFLSKPSPQHQFIKEDMHSNAKQSLSHNNFGGEIVIDFLNEIKCEEGDMDVDLNQIRCDKGNVDIDLELNQIKFEKGDDLNLFKEINFGEGDEENSLYDFDSLKSNKKRGSSSGGFHERKYKNTAPKLKKKTDPKISNINENFTQEDFVILRDCSYPQLENFELNDDNEFEDFISIETEDNLDEYVQQKSQYQMRKEKLTEEFLKKATGFAQSFIETQFKLDKNCGRESCSEGKVGSTFCETCGMLCSECDILEHSKSLHARYFHGKRIMSGLASDGSLFENILDLGISKECHKCERKLDLKKEQGTLKVVKLNGIFTAHHSLYTCSNCNVTESYTIEDFWRTRLFPVNCDPKASFVCAFDVFEQWQTLKNASPMTALSSYIQCLNRDKLMSVDQMQFDSAYQQYQKIKLTIETEMYGINNFECAAKLAPHAVHVDGDLKCKHLKLNQNESNENQTFYGSNFFIPDSEVNAVTDYCTKNKLCSKKPGDVNCGNSKWTAAGNAIKKSSPVDIKGLQLASCTHLVNVAACNLPRGELFANNLLLLRKLQDIYDLETCGSDVACKFSAWYHEKVISKPKICEDLSIKPKNIDIFLGELHSKDCRVDNSVNWKNKGRLQGLEMQEMNNNPFSRGRYRTAFMTKNRRMDEYSEMAYLINKKRNEEMVSMLLKRSKRIEVEIGEAQQVLTKAENDEGIVITEEKIDAIKLAALNVRKKTKSDFQSLIEFHSLSTAVKKLKLLSTFDPGERQKLVQNLKSHHEKLKDLVNLNNLDVTKEKLDLQNCLNGIFPWTKSFLPQEAHEKPLRFIELCEVFLKIKNSYTELGIIERDIKAILEYRIIVINNLKHGKEMFTDLVNKARAEKHLELISDLLDELQIINENKKMNIDTNYYFEKLNLEPCSASENHHKGESKDKLILEAEQKIQDLMLGGESMNEVLDIL